MLQTVVDAAQVHRDRLIPVCRRGDARVVHEHVERSERLDRALDCALHVVLEGYVRLERLRARADSGRNVIRRARIDIRDDDLRALGGEAHRDRSPDAAPAARNERYFSRKAVGHRRAPITCELAAGG